MSAPRLWNGRVPDDSLRTELTTLARKLTERGIILTIGGGYGLVLRREYIVTRGLRTRFADPPYTRSTNDVDCFLTADLISNAAATREIRTALDELGYEPLDAAKYYQFARTIDYNGEPVTIKFDFLAPPVTGVLAPTVKADSRRIRPRGFDNFHAHTTPEAVTIGESPATVELGSPDVPATVLLPHPFTYLLLKLHAFRDQVNASDRDKGRYHAFDIYTTLALTTEAEWGEMRHLAIRHSDDDAVIEAMRIRMELFDDLTALGVVRLREHAQAAGMHLSPERLGDLVGDLREIFST